MIQFGSQHGKARGRSVAPMAACVFRVELPVSCRSLLDRDPGSRSDPLCVLLQDAGGGRWTEVRAAGGRALPVGKLVVDYYFEKVQKLKFRVDDDYLGGIECTLGQVCIDVFYEK
uniref:Uncharacterized protein n=1 Tax=Cyanistes caeruleus TaxID=156563 RepID=A0A8C0UH86_CYACU